MIFLTEYYQYVKFLLRISRFSKVYDIDISAKEPNSDLEKVANGLFIRKFSLILIPISRLNEVFF